MRFTPEPHTQRRRLRVVFLEPRFSGVRMCEQVQTVEIGDAVNAQQDSFALTRLREIARNRFREPDPQLQKWTGGRNFVLPGS